MEQRIYSCDLSKQNKNSQMYKRFVNEKKVIFDAVSMMATFETYSKDDPERCKKDEVILCKEFPGYSEQLSYITYKKLFMLTETCLKEVITRFEEVDRVEILNELEKAKRKWL